MSNLVARMGLSTANLINGMKRGACFFLLAIVFFSCSRDKKPAGILSHEEMASIMIDVYLAEARLNTSLMKRDSASLVFQPYEHKLMMERGLQDSVLKKSYIYYLDHTKELEQIYDSVIDTLSLREQRAQALPPRK